MIVSKMQGKTFNKVKTILVSQPKPERSPYYDLEKKWGLKIDWRPFIQVEGLTPKEFRKQRVRPDEFTAVIFTSKNSIDHFHRLCDESRVFMSADTKYFCLSKAIADYLQKFITYRKRKVFVGNRFIQDLKTYLLRHKEEKFLLPCSNLGAKKVANYLDELKLDWKEVMMYRTVSSDLSDLEDVKYDVLIFFSPLGITSLFENFPNFEQNGTRLAIYGTQTMKAAEEKGLIADIKAPAPGIRSMSEALKNYLKKSNIEE